MCTLVGMGTLGQHRRLGTVAYRVVSVKQKDKCYGPIFGKWNHNGRMAKILYRVGTGIKYEATTKYAVGLSHPDPICYGLGFFAFKTYAQALAAHKDISAGCLGSYAVMRVRLFGKMKEYVNGYISQKMRCEAIVCGARFSEEK